MSSAIEEAAFDFGADQMSELMREIEAEMKVLPV